MSRYVQYDRSDVAEASEVNGVLVVIERHQITNPHVLFGRRRDPSHAKKSDRSLTDRADKDCADENFEREVFNRI
jgi:hypothetical protein